jgi:superfamily II DNA or RNA helicase
MVAKGGLEDLFTILLEVAQEVNSGRPLPDPQDLATRCGFLDRKALENHLIELDDGLWVPKAFEVLRVLQSLKQRFKTEDRTPLVGDVRLEIRPRYRPEYNHSPVENLAEIGAIGGYPMWSLFQIEGWQKVLDALKTKGRLVITAPTGTGKSEVFLLPLLHEAQHEQLSFLLVYPRVALLKDQLWRALKYARRTNVTVGFQFQGVGARDEFSEEHLFSEGERKFRYADCPECHEPLRLKDGNRDQVRTLSCRNKHDFQVTISRKGHQNVKPGLLLTTVESLESIYLRPEMEGFLQQVRGIVLDEAHLYDSLYGAHVHHLIQRVERMTYGKRAALLAVSATIASPEEFGEKLLRDKVTVFAYDPEKHGKHLSGIECIYVLQQHQGQKRPGSLLVQALMALGHAVFPSGEIAVAFSDSLDGVNRYRQVLEDAEKKRLYAIRTLLDEILYDSQKCPQAVPARCPIYLAGECWRGLLGGKLCCDEIPPLRVDPLKVGAYSSKQETVLAEHDVVLATSSLEVGVDEEAVSSVVQYGPPRNAAALAQRRGRAARGHGRLAYNLLVLGQEVADHFVLQHRVRLLDGQVEPPLNPKNPLVIDLHKYIEEQRKLLINEQNHASKGRASKTKGTFLWFKKKLEACPTTQALLDAQYNLRLQLNSLEHNFNREKAVDVLHNWVKTKLEESRIALELAQELDLAEEEFPAHVRAEAQAARQELKNYLSGGSAIEGLNKSLETLEHALVKYKWQIEDDQEKRKLEALADKLSYLHYEAKRRKAGLQLPLEEHERRYLFFTELHAWLNEQGGRFVFTNPPEDLRRVLRAFFFLHQGLPASHACTKCNQRPPALVPMAYFEYLKPVVYWRRNPYGEFTNETESPASPEVLFPPYRLQYRYGEGDSVALQLTDHNPDWVQSQIGVPVRIELEARAKGPLRSGYRLVQSAQLRSLRTAGGGRPIVKFCSNCGRLHHITAKACPCGKDELWSVRLYPEVLSESSFESSKVRPIGRHLVTTEEGGRGLVRVLGSHVEGKRFFYDYKKGQWVPMQGKEFSFEAFYRTPLAYEVSRTHGVGWELQSLAERLGLNTQDLAPTAVSLLRRTVAAATGVLPDLLRGSIEGSRVWAWELVDGGGGITQLFEKLCQEDPREVFTQMAKIVCCPVYLAEKKFFDDEDFTEYPRRFRLEFPEVLREAEAEYQRLIRRKEAGEAPDPTCSKEDGCPSCLREPFSRGDVPKRSLAEQLVLTLVRSVTREELVREMLASHPVLPVLLEVDGGYYVCEF